MLKHFRRSKKDKKHDSNNDGSTKSGPSSPLPLSQVRRESGSLSLHSNLSNQLPGDRTLTLRQRQRSVDRQSDPLGISVIYKPPDGLAPTIDIIFVHGLGGTSRVTWSYNRDLRFFWPKEWLPNEPGFDRARMLSFGYNANFMSTAPANFLNIADFAKDLLMQMKFVTDETMQPLNIGKNPIVFVVHSMGGLVVKKAFVLGLLDKQFEAIVENVRAIVFLATPHKGSAFAGALNMLLGYSPLNHHPKVYISELERNSRTLHEINEDFRHVVSKLEVVSFFETVETKVGPRTLAIVEKDSSVLGYPEEISAPLDADHHGICKFESQEDPNYRKVRNLIWSLISRFQRKITDRPGSSTTGASEVPEQIALSLGITETPEADFELFVDLKMPGSCTWLESEKGYRDWLSDSSLSPSVLWINGLPGSGKTILATFVRLQLRDMGEDCQFFYFRHGERAKRSTAALLKSLIYQLASSLPRYRAKLLKLVEKGQNLRNAESRLLWQKAIVGILDKIELKAPIYWVIDALDECDAPQTIMSLLTSLTTSSLPLRVLITGRVQPLEQHFERLAKILPLVTVSSVGSGTDLRRFVQKEMEFVHCDPELKTHVTEVVLQKANGNFLWTRLVLTAVQDRLDPESIEVALQEIPSELSELYYRMESRLVDSYGLPTDKNFARAVLSWVLCAQRPLTMQELGNALHPEHPIANLQRRVFRTCGEFVRIDKNDKISVVHDTVREFLTTTKGLSLSIEPSDAHLQAFTKCLTLLIKPNLKIRFETSSEADFIRYAALSWSHHLSRSCAHEDGRYRSMLVSFLRGQSVLAWIYMLATWGKLRILVSSSKDLQLFAQRKSAEDSTESPLSESFQDRDFLESWATDLVKLVAKFGTHLSRFPDSIFSFVPAFCPYETAIHQQFCSNSPLSISGLSRPTWDDYLARFSVGKDTQALGILCSNRYFATLTVSHIVVWYADTFEEACKIKHGERVLSMKFSLSGDMLVTCGFRLTKVWDMSTYQELFSFHNPSDTKTMDIAFAKNDSRLYSFTEDGVIRSVSLSLDAQWQPLASSLGDGIFDNNYGSPKLVSFHPEGYQIAIAYRGVPVLVWNLTPLKFLGKCRRPGEKDSTQFWADVNDLDWNATTGHVVGVYNDGCLFKWHPTEFASEETMTTAALISCSPDGNLIVTSSTDGTLRVWNFHTLALLYQLSCTSQSAAIAISPDSRRIYDIRESICNIWQPNTLIRMAEADEKSSDSSSASLGSIKASEAIAQLLEPITALLADPHGTIVFTGDDEGVLKLIEIDGGTVRELSNCWITVSCIISGLSEHGTRVATADLYGRVSVSCLSPTSPGQEYFQILDIKTQGEQIVKQLLFSPDAELLLIVSDQGANVWFIRQKRKIAIAKLNSGIPFFVNHPTDISLLLAFGVSNAQVMRWQDLDQIASFEYDDLLLPEPEGISAPQEFHNNSLSRMTSTESYTQAVNGVHVTADASMFLLKLSQHGQSGPRTHHFVTIKGGNITMRYPSSSANVLPIRPLPQALLTAVEMVLGLLSFDATASDRRSFAQNHRSLVTTSTAQQSDLLAFVDREFWVCTWSLSDTKGSQIKKHFFLPRDWINMECLELATVTRDGLFLFPKNGEVAIVKDGFKIF